MVSPALNVGKLFFSTSSSCMPFIIAFILNKTDCKSTIIFLSKQYYNQYSFSELYFKVIQGGISSSFLRIFHLSTFQFLLCYPTLRFSELLIPCNFLDAYKWVQTICCSENCLSVLMTHLLKLLVLIL